MLDYTSISIGILVIVTAVYAYLDVFNKRNVPNYFVYATLAVAVLVSLFGTELPLTYAITLIIGGVGFVLYRAGLLGGGDVFEFVFICLVLPFWSQPLYYGMFQFFLPFIVSVLIGAGYASLIFIPIYYILIKKRGKRLSRPDRRSVTTAVVLLAAYVLFVSLLYFTLKIGFDGVSLLTLLAVASFFTILCESDIYLGMVSFIYPRQLEEGDMIAVNLMTKSDAAYFRKYDNFGRLATKDLIARMKVAKRKLPVYRDSVPFSAFVFIGVIVSLMFGNIILLMVGA